MNVAALYATDDGATRFYVTLDEDMLEPQVSFGQSFSNGVKVDWGMEVHRKQQKDGTITGLP